LTGSVGVAQIIEILGELSAELGVPVITPEYEIALTLLDFAELTADELMGRSSLSRAGFFNTINRLKTWSVVVSTPKPDDRRCKLYRLSDDVHDLIIVKFKQYQESHIRFSSLGIHRSDLAATSNEVKRGDKLEHLSCEYQILLYLYILPDRTHSELRTLVDASITKFNSILVGLVDKGLVYSSSDAADKRRKLYQISSTVRRIIDGSHRKVFDWLEGKERGHL
jgi:DNA-binding MarR family transcriptional regulator